MTSSSFFALPLGEVVIVPFASCVISMSYDGSTCPVVTKVAVTTTSSSGIVNDRSDNTFTTSDDEGSRGVTLTEFSKRRCVAGLFGTATICTRVPSRTLPDGVVATVPSVMPVPISMLCFFDAKVTLTSTSKSGITNFPFSTVTVSVGLSFR